MWITLLRIPGDIGIEDVERVMRIMRKILQVGAKVRQIHGKRFYVGDLYVGKSNPQGLRTMRGVGSNIGNRMFVDCVRPEQGLV